MQRLTAEELEEQAQCEKAVSANGASVWNQVHLDHASYQSYREILEGMMTEGL